MDLLNVSRFPSQKRLYNKGHFNLAIEVLKGFRPGVSKRLCATHSGSSNNGSLEQTSELIISFFLKLLWRPRLLFQKLRGSLESSVFLSSS